MRTIPNRRRAKCNHDSVAHNHRPGEFPCLVTSSMHNSMQNSSPRAPHSVTVPRLLTRLAFRAMKPSTPGLNTRSTFRTSVNG